jgi:hypothetical protein
MGIPIVAGETFSAADGPDSRDVVVNDTFVRAYLDGGPPVGAVFQWGEKGEPHRIVGVVKGTKNMSIGEDDQPQMYQPLSRMGRESTRLQFVMRSATPPATQVAGVRSVLRQVEPNAGTEVATLFSSIGMAFLPSQIGAALMGSIGLLGLLLAAIGLHGVISYSVARRTREFGVRMAIGATGRQISRMVLSESARLLFTGTAIGIAAALVVTRPLAMFFVPGLSSTDPTAFAGVLLVLGLTGLAATLGPMRRALAVDPAKSLRYE